MCLLWSRTREGIGLCGDLQLGIFDVGVNLRRVQVLMTEHLLHRSEVHAVCDHQRGSGVAQLVRGVLLRVQSGRQHVLFDQTVHSCHAQALVVAGAEQRPIVIQNDFVAFGKVGVQRLTRRFAEIDETLFVPFACYTNSVVVYVISIQADQLRAADAADLFWLCA